MMVIKECTVCHKSYMFDQNWEWQYTNICQECSDTIEVTIELDTYNSKEQKRTFWQTLELVYCGG